MSFSYKGQLNLSSRYLGLLYFVCGNVLGVDSHSPSLAFVNQFDAPRAVVISNEQTSQNKWRFSFKAAYRSPLSISIKSYTFQSGSIFDDGSVTPDSTTPSSGWTENWTCQDPTTQITTQTDNLGVETSYLHLSRQVQSIPSHVETEADTSLGIIASLDYRVKQDKKWSLDLCLQGSFYTSTETTLASDSFISGATYTFAGKPHIGQPSGGGRPRPQPPVYVDGSTSSPQYTYSPSSQFLIKSRLMQGGVGLTLNYLTTEKLTLSISSLFQVSLLDLSAPSINLNDTKLLLGVSVNSMATYQISTKWALMGSAGYDFIPTADDTLEGCRIEVDASGFVAGIGVVYTF